MPIDVQTRRVQISIGIHTSCFCWLILFGLSFCFHCQSRNDGAQRDTRAARKSQRAAGEVGTGCACGGIMNLIDRHSIF